MSLYRRSHAKGVLDVCVDIYLGLIMIILMLGEVALLRIKELNFKIIVNIYLYKNRQTINIICVHDLYTLAHFKHSTTILKNSWIVKDGYCVIKMQLWDNPIEEYQVWAAECSVTNIHIRRIENSILPYPCSGLVLKKMSQLWFH